MFDVLVLSPKSAWTSVSRFDNADLARTEARRLAESKRHMGVKVTQEHFDEAENRFIEKTIFLRTKNGSRMPNADTARDGFNGFESEDDDESSAYTDKLLIGIAAVIILLAVVLGTGLYYFDDSPDYHPKQAGDLFRYDLPTIRTNVTSGGRTYSLEITLQMELYRAEDVKEIEAGLGPLMESVIDHLQHVDARELNKRSRLQYLRAKLRGKVKNAIGDTDFHDILFKDIQVR